MMNQIIRGKAGKRRIRFLTALIFVFMFVSVLASVPAKAEQTGLTETEGVFRVGMEANYAPFNWSQTDDKDGAYPIVNSSGEYANGYDVQIAKRIADGLGMKLEIVKTEWDGLPPSLISGKTDAIIAGMSPTAERKEIIDFTDNYYTSDLVLVVQKDGKWDKKQSIADYAGAKITGQLNTFHYTVIDQIAGVVKEVAMDSFPTMISSLKTGKIDAYVSERPGAMAAAAANTDLAYVAFEPGKGFETSSEDTSIAVGIRKGSPLGSEVNNILAQIPEEERQKIMSDMIAVQTGTKEEGFFESVSSLVKEYGLLFLSGAGNTLLVSIIATFIGFILGMLVAIVRSIQANKNSSIFSRFFIGLFKGILTVYVEVFRGTPMMVQAMLIYYGSKLFFHVDMSAMGAALLIVSINTGAYMAEVVRGGIASVDTEQMEACKSIGLTHWQSMRHVILPQTIKAILPSVGNEFVVNIKDTSVLNVISVTELFFVTKSVAGSTYKIFQAYFIASVVYLVLTFLATRLVNFIGKKTGQTKEFSLSSATKI